MIASRAVLKENDPMSHESLIDSQIRLLFCNRHQILRAQVIT
jgi:hypothetical protein